MNRTSLVVFFAWAAAAVQPVVSVAQEPPSIQLIVQTERPVVELGEPVYVTARLINNGTRSISAWTSLNPKAGQLKISVRDPQGRAVGFMPLSVHDSDAAPSAIEPRQQVAQSVPIFFGASGWVFRVPGRYTVSAKYDLRTREGFDTELEATAFYIDVKEGDSRIARVLDGGEVSLQAGRFIEWRGGDQLNEGRALLEEVTTALPQSALANHYRVAAGRSWVRPFKDYRLSAVRPAEPARALTELERVREQQLPTTVLVEKQLAEAKALLDLNRPQGVASRLARTRALVNERPELAGFDEQLTRLERVSGQPVRQ